MDIGMQGQSLLKKCRWSERGMMGNGVGMDWWPWQPLPTQHIQFIFYFIIYFCKFVYTPHCIIFKISLTLWPSFICLSSGQSYLSFIPQVSRHYTGPFVQNSISVLLFFFFCSRFNTLFLTGTGCKWNLNAVKSQNRNSRSDLWSLQTLHLLCYPYAVHIAYIVP